MIYMILTQPFKDYNKAKISSFQFHVNGKIVFYYQIYKNSEVLFDKSIILGESAEIDKIKTQKFDSLSPYDSICKSLLQYLQKIGTLVGTIEVE